MPNRYIKAAIHESEDVNRMTDFQFRLWVNLITYVDDFGRGDARPAIIKGNCFPLRERLTQKEIADALSALAGIGCISLYKVDGKPYLYFPAWEKHQRKQSSVSKFPAPPEVPDVNHEDETDFPQVTVTHGDSRRVTESLGDSPPITNNDYDNEYRISSNEYRSSYSENDNDNENIGGSDAISLLEQNKRQNRALARRAYLEKINAQASERTLTELDAFAEAMGGDVCAAAMDIALKAHKGTWPYVRGILRHAKEAGVMCLPEFEEYQTKGTISDE